MADKLVFEVEIGGGDVVKFLNDVRQAISQVNSAAADPALDKLERGLNKIAQAGKTSSKTIKDNASSLEDASRRIDKAMQAIDGRDRTNRRAEDKSAAKAWDQEFGDLSRQVDGAAQAQAKLENGLSRTRYALYDVSRSLAVAGAALLSFGGAAIGAAISFEKNFAQVVRIVGSEIGYTNPKIEELRQGLISLSQDMPVSFAELANIAALGGQLGISADELDEFTTVVAKLTATTDLSSEAAGTALGRFRALLGVPASEFEALASAILKVGVNSVATETQIVTIATRIAGISKVAGLTYQDVVALSGALASVGVQPFAAQGSVIRLFTRIGQEVDRGGEKLEAYARISKVSADEFASAYGTERFGPILRQLIVGLGDVAVNGGSASKALEDLGIKGTIDIRTLTQLAAAQGVVNAAWKDSVEGASLATELSEQYGVTASTAAARLKVLGQSITALFASIGGGATGPIADFLDFLNDIVIGITDFTKTDFGQIVSVVALISTALLGFLALLGSALARMVAGGIAARQAWLGVSRAMGIAGGTATATAGAMNLLGVSTTRASGAARLLGTALRALTVVGIFAFLAESSGAIDNWAKDMSGVSTELGDTLSRLKIPEDPGQFLGKEGLGSFAKATEGVIAFNRAMGGWASQDASDLKAADEGLAAMIKSGNAAKAADELRALKERWIELGGSTEGFKKAFPDTIRGLEETAVNAEGAEGSVGDLATAERDAALATEMLGIALGLTDEQLKEFVKGLVSAQKSFTDLSPLMKQQQAETTEWAKAQSKAATGSEDEWKKWYDGTSINLSKFNDDLQKQVDALNNWQSNLQALAGRGVSAEILADLARLGPEGAPFVAALVDGSAEELDRFTGLWGQTGAGGAEAWADAFTQNIPLLEEAGRKGGDAAVKELIDALQVGGPQLQAVINKYNLTATVGANTNPAQSSVTQLINANNGRTITLNVRANTDGSINFSGLAGGGRSYATGGYISGPGTGTSDSIPARLSNGEYVIRAASVRKYGMGYFDALNRGVAKFASGGPVRTSGGGGGGAGMSYLDPSSANLIRSVAALADRPVYVYLGDELISKSAARGDRVLSGRGAR